MKKIKELFAGNNMAWFFKMFIFLFSVSVLFTPLNNPDLFWHLSAGKYIINNLALPNFDFLSWTEYGAVWFDFEWLTQIVYYLIYLIAGFKGLFVFKLIMSGLIFAVLRKILIHTISKRSKKNEKLYFSTNKFSFSNRDKHCIYTLIFFSIIHHRHESFSVINGIITN